MKQLLKPVLLLVLLLVFGCNLSRFTTPARNASPVNASPTSEPAKGPFSKAIVGRLKTGMTLKEAEQILGGSGVESARSSSDYMIKWGPDTAGRRLTVVFRSDKVSRWTHEIPAGAEE